MEHREQLEWERRVGRYAAYAAFVATLLPIAGNILLGSALGDVAEGESGLVAFEREPGGVLGAAGLQALGTLLLALPLFYLYRATRYRRPEVPFAALLLSLLAPLVVAVAAVAYQLALIDAARELVASGPRTDDRAEDLIRDGAAGPLEYVLYVTRALLATAFILVSLQAIRAGLLSRFMGYLGVIVGVLFVLGGPSFILFFWMPALGLLFLNRWPGGRGPAWETGEPIPWPSAAEQREALERQRGEQEGERNGGDPVAERQPASGDPDTPRAGAPRKRKRRR